jgi:O-methyltransferase
VASRLAALRRPLEAAAGRFGYRIARVPSLERAAVSHPDISDPVFYDLCRRCGPFTMTTIERMYALHQAVTHVTRTGIEGDIVECGVWRGGSSMLAALTLMQLGDRERTLWLYDTFEGMPEPGAWDRDPRGALMADEWERHREHADDPVFAYAGLADVQVNMRTTGYPEQRVALVKGKVEDTIPGTVPDRVAVLRLDTDWYESTRHELEHLYPLLEPGGVLIVDDYGYWQGARKAVDDWLATQPRPPLLARVDDTGRMGIKPA